MLIGYGRVSTAEQNPAHQIDALARAGVAREHIYIDTASGAKASRPKLDLVLNILRGGDTLVVTRLDRLGRSMPHLINLGADLREREVGLKVSEQGIDTAEGRAMFGMLSVLAEFQRELIVANTRDGLAAARARGRKGGRRPKLTPAQVQQAQRLYDEGRHTVAEIAEMFGVPVRPPTATSTAPPSAAGPAPQAPHRKAAPDDAPGEPQATRRLLCTSGQLREHRAYAGPCSPSSTQLRGVAAPVTAPAGGPRHPRRSTGCRRVRAARPGPRQ